MDFLEISLKNQGGENLKLSDYKGKWLLLYFYPKDDTPGCTKQACALREQKTKWDEKNIKIFGVSKDSPKSHQKFIEKYGLNFDLISDESEELCKFFDVLKQKQMYGKTYLGIERSTFLIDPNGKVVKEWRKVDPETHEQLVWEEFLKHQ